MLIPAIALATLCATLLGGLFALKLSDKLHLILGFSAGAVVAVAFFDLLPEALELAGDAYGPANVAAIVGLGFILYLMADRLAIPACCKGHHHDEAHRGHAGASSLTLHSFLDGVGIGLAFHVNAAVGTTVAAAVLAHDFCDGINTVNMIRKHKGTRREAVRWLLADALAPVFGVLATLLLSVPESELGMVLALFAGFFLYIGAADLIPESHHAHPVRYTSLMTVLGFASLYVIIKLAGV
jgi:ZIP family zinc transporter